MNLKEIKELIALVVEKGLTEFELERSGVKVRIKRPNPAENGMIVAPLTPQVILPPVAVTQALPGTAPAGHLPPAPAEAAPPAGPQEDLHFIKSPIVGTFYASPNPDAPPFAKPGDSVEAGQTLCIIEAMKLMNEIESDMAGEIVKCYVANSQPVEYGERLFSLRPRRKK